MSGLIDAVRRANRPGPPEHSIVLRVAAAGSVATGILACASVQEINVAIALVAVALICTGNAVSYQRRARPLPLLKLGLAFVMLASFVWFFVTVSASARVGDLGSVEGPLAGLFTAMQTAHSFDVPARRDLGFSLAGSATLMAVAAAQAVDLGFGAFVILWAAFVLAGLSASWGSMAGGARVAPGVIVASALAALALGVGLLAVLPPPSPASGLVTPTALGGGGTSPEPSKAVTDTHPPDQQPASASGPTGVGGFLGFAGPLDTAVRASLGNQIVLRVRASEPTFWIAETFNTWSGQSWNQINVGGSSTHQVAPGPPYRLSSRPEPGQVEDSQTFYVGPEGSDLVLHAAQAQEVWYPTKTLFENANGTLKTSTYLAAGSVYTVLSDVAKPSVTQLEAANGTAGLGAKVAAQDEQLPHPYPKVAALARRITAHDHTTYAKVKALEVWIGTHTEYTTDIPPLGRGQDTVTQFLFHTKKGYCEQISTSLTIMLRTLGIPAQEATGYVPGTFDPITHLYEVQAKDAHAWVQVWFPGYGWQSFDPTADVPLANPSTAAALGHLFVTKLRIIPVIPVAVAAVVFVGAMIFMVGRRRRPAHWRAAVTAQLEQAARAVGVPIEPTVSLSVLAAGLDAALDDGPVKALEVATATERAAWAEIDFDPTTCKSLVADARRVRRLARKSGRGPGRRRRSPRTRVTAGRP